MKKRASSWTLAGGVFAAIVASLCCIGPVVALGLGVGSFAAGTFFAQWRPLFLLLTFALLGAAWFMAYRRPNAKCDGATCARPPGKALRISLWVGTLVAILATAYPWLADAQGDSSPVETLPSGEKLSVKIPSMDCAACAKGIEASLQRAPGVVQARVSYDTKTAHVVFDPEKTNKREIIAAIDATGFRGEEASVK